MLPPWPQGPAASDCSGVSGSLLIAYTVVVLLMAYRLASTYVGGHYVCPRCGARRADRHAGDCPWSH